MGLNSPEYALCMIGAFKQGITVTPISASYKQPEITRQLEMSEAEKILIEKRFLPLVLDAMKNMESMIFLCRAVEIFEMSDFNFSCN